MCKKISCLQWAALMIVALLAVCAAVAYIGVMTTHDLLVPGAAYADLDVSELTVKPDGRVALEVSKAGLRITQQGAGRAEILLGNQIVAMTECGENGFMRDKLSGHYTGDKWVMGVARFFLLGTIFILGAALRKQMKKEFYHYATPLLMGFLLMSGMILVVQSLLPGKSTLENLVAQMPPVLLIITLPFIAQFELAMFISNVSLLKHEGKTWRNLLGSLIGFALSMAALVIMLHSDASGSLEDLHFHDLLLNFFSGLVLWTECKLAGIILCGVKAAKGQPAMDKDYILILGCKLSRKGGLTPLLRGRVDRALAFARQQAASTGHMPVLIPCGGQGADELRSEASAMREYLLEQGVPEDGILSEDRSVNTWENIRNAQAMMKPNARVAYSTTNYHVFRAGVWASRNGLNAQGMGSRTKWYYWPNAFMREYVALIAANLPHELLMIALIGLQSSLLAYLYH